MKFRKVRSNLKWIIPAGLLLFLVIIVSIIVVLCIKQKKTDTSSGVQQKNSLHSPRSNNNSLQASVSSNLDKILSDSTKDFEKREVSDRQESYVINFTYNTKKNEWSYILWNGGVRRSDNEKTVIIPKKECDFCKKGEDRFLYNKDIQNAAKVRELRILIAPRSNRILIIPQKCIKFWFDFDSDHLGKGSKKEALFAIQKNILELAVIVRKELCNKFNWPSDIYKFDINIGNNIVPHIHFRFTEVLTSEQKKKVDEWDKK